MRFKNPLKQENKNKKTLKITALVILMSAVCSLNIYNAQEVMVDAQDSVSVNITGFIMPSTNIEEVDMVKEETSKNLFIEFIDYLKVCANYFISFIENILN